MSDNPQLQWKVFLAIANCRNRAKHDLPPHEYTHPNKPFAIAEGKRVLRELLSRGDERDWYAGIHYDPFKVNEVKEPNTVTRISIHDVA